MAFQYQYGVSSNYDSLKSVMIEDEQKKEEVPALTEQKDLNSVDNDSNIGGLLSELCEEVTFAEIKKVNEEICLPEKTEMKFFRVCQLSYEEEYPKKEAFENVLRSIDTISCNIVYLLTGQKDGIELDIGFVANGTEVSGEDIDDLGKSLLFSFEGNFKGSRLKQLKGTELERAIRNVSETFQHGGMIVGIPSVNEEEEKAKEKENVQGIDRLINSMMGQEWRIAIVCEQADKSGIRQQLEDIYTVYNTLAEDAKKQLQKSRSAGLAAAAGKNSGKQKGNDWHYDKNKAKTRNSERRSSQEGETTGTGGQESIQTGESLQVTLNIGNNEAVTVELINKQYQEHLDYLDKELIPRLRKGLVRGLYKTSVYYMAKNPASAERLKAGLISLYQGNNSSFSPMTAVRLSFDNNTEFRKILESYRNYSISNEANRYYLLLKGIPYNKGNIGINTFLTTDEVSLLMGLPQKEVPGIALREGVEFGLNPVLPGCPKLLENTIKLGPMVQIERVLEESPYSISRDALMKHTFIAGVTGSGKTTTCHKLLKEAHLPFLVIEPAKTEYRILLNNQKFGEQGIPTVFTLGDEQTAPFRLNPFELVEGELISAHVDMIKAAFTSAFPMEASMPQILEEAIYRCYEKKGWDIDTSCYISGENAFASDSNCFPTMSDLLSMMDEIVDEKRFAPELAANYKGSLVSRLSNLTVGSKGRMLDCYRSTDFNYILDHNVILELEEVRNTEDKAFLIGLILARLSAMYRLRSKKDPSYRHLTLVEEAHRLLSKTEFGDSGSKKAAVEIFTDLLAEVRKYGEGLVIVDQIPNKLAPEVIKNTNTKIIHKILAKDDKDAVGDTMLMDDKQKEYLSALPVGHAIIFSDQTQKPIHIKIESVSDTSGEIVSNEKVREQFRRNERFFGYSTVEKELFYLYKLFYKTMKGVLKKEDTDITELKQKVDATAKQKNKEKEDIWKMLLNRWEVIEGHSLAKGWGDSTERVEFLADYLNERVDGFFKTENLKQLSENQTEDYETYRMFCKKLGQ